MASPTITGLAGLDTASIIDQLMSVEAQPQNSLKTKLSTQQSTLSNLQDLNSKVAALATQAADLAKASSWAPLKVTSSSDSVTATAGTGTAAGSFDVTVVQTAATHKLTFASAASGTDHVTGSSNQVVVTVGGVAHTIDAGDGSLSGLVSGLNQAGTGVKASTVRLDDGTQRLVVQAATSGAAASFTLTAADGSDLLGGASVQQGRDAAITVGPDTLHSATNSFTDVLSGVSLTIGGAAVGTTVQVNVSTDTSAVQDKVKSLVDAVNTALSTIDKLTAYDPTTKSAGPLVGDPAVRSLRDALLNAVYPGDGTSMAGMGLQTDRSGKLVFDPTAFAAAYAANPDKVASSFTAGTQAGFAQRVNVVAAAASDPYTGTLTASVTGQNSSIKGLQDSIADWDTRLTLRRTALQQQFTAMETALNQMNSQSSWLSGQINSLSSSSGS